MPNTKEGERSVARPAWLRVSIYKGTLDHQQIGAQSYLTQTNQEDNNQHELDDS